MPRPRYAASLVAVFAIAVAVLAASCAAAVPAAQQTRPPVASSLASPSAPRPTAAPLNTASPVPSPSAEASPSGIAVLGASGSGAFGPGTYSTAFEPALTFTLVDQTLLGSGGTIAYESIGETDVNSPGWVSISFGFDKAGRHGHGTWSADFSVDRIDKVFDPSHPGTAVDPPKDLTTWLTRLPGVTLAARPTAVRVGGLPATQLDLVAGRAGVTVGPIPGTTDPPAFGFGPGQPARIIIVKVHGHRVLITLGGADGADHFARVVAALQPLVDSIAWR